MDSHLSVFLTVCNETQIDITLFGDTGGKLHAIGPTHRL